MVKNWVDEITGKEPSQRRMERRQSLAGQKNWLRRRNNFGDENFGKNGPYAQFRISSDGHPAVEIPPLLSRYGRVHKVSTKTLE